MVATFIVPSSTLLRVFACSTQVIKKARWILKHTPRAINPTHLLADFVPLSGGLYPVFNNYPAFIVDYQVGCDRHSSCLCDAFGVVGNLHLLFGFYHSG